MNRILVAGIGNVFKGDDAFGPAVAQVLAQRDLPEGVDVVDIGIRGIDLTYALLDDYDAAVLVDTVQRDGAPGTLYVIEPTLPDTNEPPPAAGLFAAHDLDPASVLRLVAALGGRCERLRLVGCEPETFGEEDVMCLSAPALAAVEAALPLIESQIRELQLDGPRPQSASGSGNDRAETPMDADPFYAPGERAGMNACTHASADGGIRPVLLHGQEPEEGGAQ